MGKVLFVGSGSRYFESAYKREPGGWQLEIVDTIAAAAVVLQSADVEIVFADIPPEDEARLVGMVRARNPRTPVICLSAPGAAGDRGRSLLEGVKAGLNRPVNKELLTGALHKLNQPINRQLFNSALERLNQPVTGPGAGPRPRAIGVRTMDTALDSPLVGGSRAMSAVRERILAVGRSDCSVLIVGESGTGKELAARSIHENSIRASMPFIAVNCASLPDELLESELFGHAKGAFSGATRDRKGLIEEATGGTFLLDEIPSASPAIQAKLLRFLENKTFRRLGDNQEIYCDVRMLACSNANLDDLSRNGKFRSDLLFRLDVVRIELPPLRERREDLPALVAHFMQELGARYPGAVGDVSLEYQQWLSRHDFPGNVRELRNLLEAGIVTSSGGVLTPADLPSRLRGAKVETAAEDLEGGSEFRRRLAVAGRDVIVEALRRNGENLDSTAKELGMGRTTLWRRMTEYGLNRARKQG